MIKFIIARNNNEIYENYIKKSLLKLDAISYDIFDEENTKFSITEKYNIGIEHAMECGLEDNDIVIFIHEDVLIQDDFFKEKVELTFNANPLNDFHRAF